MAGPPASHPVPPDGAGSSGNAWQRPRGGGFEWVAPAPSPVVVEELENFYPDVIQVPLRSLEAEEVRWGSNAILARCLARWIPPEFILREFYRAGLPGKIEALALADKHYIVQFSDIRAKALALGRPWVVYGQPIITDDWSPEFVPANSSLRTALLWIRLPQLPIEFWAEDILSSILAVAGEFLYADEATKERKRGSFARACVRVDLSKALRPGARIRGSKSPFWQQFSYENLEGICGTCGSLHLSGTCLMGQSSSPSSLGPGFGPWMSAIRRRKAPLAPGVQHRVPVPSPVPSGGWQAPRKVARRQASGGTSSFSRSLELQPPTEPSLGINQHSDDFVKEAGQGSDPGILTETVPVGTVHQLQSETLVSNPFSCLDSECGMDRPKSREGGGSGLLKRTRAAESSALRVVSKSSKGKGKAPLRGISRSLGSFAFQASVDPAQGSLDPAGAGKRKSRRKSGSSQRSDPGASLPARVEGSDHESAVLQLKKAILRSELSAGTASPLVEDPAPLVEVAIAQGSPFAEDCRGLGPVMVTLPTTDLAIPELMGTGLGSPPQSNP